MHTISAEQINKISAVLFIFLMTGSHASAKLGLLLLGEASEQASLPLPLKSCEVFWMVSKHLPTLAQKTHNSIPPINTSVDSCRADTCLCSAFPFLPIESFSNDLWSHPVKKSAEDTHLVHIHGRCCAQHNQSAFSRALTDQLRAYRYELSSNGIPSITGAPSSEL